VAAPIYASRTLIPRANEISEMEHPFLVSSFLRSWSRHRVRPHTLSLVMFGPISARSYPSGPRQRPLPRLTWTVRLQNDRAPRAALNAVFFETSRQLASAEE